MSTDSLLAVRPHRDLAKFEFEDLLLREALPNALRAIGGLVSLGLDLRTEQQGRDDRVPDDLGAMVRVRESSSGRSAARALMTQLGDAGIVDAAWAVRPTMPTTPGAQLGTHVPGVKDCWFLRMGEAVDSPDLFAPQINAAVEAIVTSAPPAQISVLLVEDDLMASPVTDAFVSVLMDSHAALDAVHARRGFDPLVRLEDAGASIFRVRAIEHRLSPNPNLWLIDAERPEVESVTIT